MAATKSRSLIKSQISKILFDSDEIYNILTEKVKNGTFKQQFAEYDKHVKSHLFVDDTLTDKGSYIFFDVALPQIRPRITTCKIYVFVICHRDILDGFRLDGYFGNRADILTELVEETLLDAGNVHSYGIGQLNLEAVDIYNTANYYGAQLIFDVPNFT